MILLIAAVLQLQADPAHSSAAFTVRHMMISTVRGQFGKLTSTLEWNQDDPAKSAVAVQLDPATIDTREPERDGNLRGPDFFDAARCPVVSFKSSRIDKKGKDLYAVTGALTMRCTTRPVTLNVTFNPHGVKTPWGATVYAASATGKLKRSEWGLTWNQALESGGVLVSDEVALDLQLEYSPAH